MSIGTAKPTAEELAAVPHHFIGTRSATEDYSAGRYEEEALQCIEELFRRHDILFLVGGSGLYIDALCNGMDALPQTDPDLRQQLTRELEQQGLEALTLRLRDLDPIYYEQVDRANPQRIIRALEVCLQTGKPYSSPTQTDRQTTSVPYSQNRHTNAPDTTLRANRPSGHSDDGARFRGGGTFVDPVTSLQRPANRRLQRAV